jgi:hypothetical protein
MPEEPAEGLISLETVERVAAIFERYHDAFNPESSDAKEAEVEFNREAERLHSLAQEGGFDVSLFNFKAHLRYRCRVFLGKN